MGEKRTGSHDLGMSSAMKKKMFRNQPFVLQEAINALRTSIRFSAVDGGIKKILITSAMPGEGKSSIALNLARSLAKDGSNVVLVDCDLRKPMLNSYSGTYGSNKLGLSTYLCGEAKFNDCIVRDSTYNMYYLPAGQVPPNPAEMLGSKSFKALMDFLNEKFDYIICDSPPVEVVSDAAILSTLCDGVVFVVRHKYTKKTDVDHATSALKSVGAKILGIVLNDYDDPDKIPSRYDIY